MPFPVLPLVIGGAGVALLFAGSQEKKATSPGGASDNLRSGTTATPTTQTTGGAQGGAQAPSHADYVNTSTEPTTVDGPPNPTAPTSYTGGVGSVRTGTAEEIAAGESSTGLPEASVSDYTAPPDGWAPTAGGSLDVKKVESYVSPTTGLTGAVGSLTDVSILAIDGATKASADVFRDIGSSFGLIW